MKKFTKAMVAIFITLSSYSIYVSAPISSSIVLGFFSLLIGTVAYLDSKSEREKSEQELELSDLTRTFEIEQKKIQLADMKHLAIQQSAKRDAKGDFGSGNKFVF